MLIIGDVSEGLLKGALGPKHKKKPCTTRVSSSYLKYLRHSRGRALYLKHVLQIASARWRNSGRTDPPSSKLWHDAEAIKDAWISTDFTFSTFFTHTRHPLSVDFPFLHNWFLEECQQYCTPIYQYAARPSANRRQIGHQHLALRCGDSRRLHCWRSVVSGRSSSGSSQKPPSAYALVHALCGNRAYSSAVNTKSRSKPGDSLRIIRNVVQNEGGVKALYRGLWPNMLGNSLGWGLYFLW